MDDHDLRMGPSTTLSANSVNWTGGLTDRWERRELGNKWWSSRPPMSYTESRDLDINNRVWAPLYPIKNGLGLVGSGIERVVEIGWALDSEQYSQSPIWAEEAFITESFGLHGIHNQKSRIMGAE